MHTRGKGRNSLERQRIPLGAAKNLPLLSFFTLMNEGVGVDVSKILCSIRNEGYGVLIIYEL